MVLRAKGKDQEQKKQVILNWELQWIKEMLMVLFDRLSGVVQVSYLPRSFLSKSN